MFEVLNSLDHVVDSGQAIRLGDKIRYRISVKQDGNIFYLYSKQPPQLK